jgi:hypothetical protein
MILRQMSETSMISAFIIIIIIIIDIDIDM